MMMIETRGLCKSFGELVVLDNIDLDVAGETIFALLGPNGAGKTTAVQILSTLIRVDSGEVQVAGHDLAHEPDAVRAAIGVIGQFPAVDNLLTGEENLLLMADLHHLRRSEGRKRRAALIECFDLVDAARKRPTAYSGGSLADTATHIARMRGRVADTSSSYVLMVFNEYKFGESIMQTLFLREGYWLSVNVIDSYNG